MQAYTYIQSRFYRSPEVIMGLSYGTAIDMWSFGCLLMELLLGEPLFPGSSELDQMQQICSLLGLPPVEWIEKAGYERRQAVFRKEGRGRYSLIKADKEVTLSGGGNMSPLVTLGKRKLIDLVRAKMSHQSGASASDPSPTTHPTIQDPCLSEYFHFADLIERILVFDPEERLTPSEALLHPFTRSRSNQAVNTDLSSAPPSVLVS
jgi:dual specificity protein kinase YAK1